MRVELGVSLLVEPEDIVEDEVSVDEDVLPLVVPLAPSVEVLELVLGVEAVVEPLAPMVDVLGVLELDVLALAPPWPPALALPDEPLVPAEAAPESLPDAEPPAEAPPPAATATPPIARAAAAASVVTIFFMSWTP